MIVRLLGTFLILLNSEVPLCLYCQVDILFVYLHVFPANIFYQFEPGYLNTFILQEIDSTS